MSAPITVRIVELSDRYLIIDAITGLDVEHDDIGWADGEAARQYARGQGWIVEEAHG